MAYFFIVSRLNGVSTLTNNIVPPPLESWSERYGVLKLPIKKFPIGQLSSTLVSEIIKNLYFPRVDKFLSRHPIFCEIGHAKNGCSKAKCVFDRDTARNIVLCSLLPK